ncbi:MlrC C-terminal domain-containing protein, partial [Candidatus Bathyarchaeota archaeon]|nr:MlrC C-terminal domain-containing protein [Candidatus Bathyarchaeota archaeon]
TEYVISLSLFPVQPRFDVPELGWSTIVITDGSNSLAQQIAAELANYAWAARREFFGAELVSPGEAVIQAVEAQEGPVILADGSDNMNSGAPGDSTCLLGEMLRQEIQCVALLPMVDPEAVAAAIGAGIGSEVTLLVGGKRDHIFSQPVEVTGRVTRIGDGQVRSTGHLPIDFDMGRTVLLEVGSIKIVLSEHPGPSHEPGVYQHLGLDPHQAQIVVVKTPVGFRVAYRSIMKQALIVDCPGLSTPHLESLDYVRVPRPLFPFDDISEWHA